MNSSTVADVRKFGAVGDGRTDDTVAIKEAIAVLKAKRGGPVGTLLIPDGTYCVNESLHTGYDLDMYPNLALRCRHDPDVRDQTPMDKSSRICIRGTGRAVLKYTGPKTNDYLLYCSGHGRGFDVINGLVLECKHRCRGLFAGYLNYQSALRNMEIRHSWGIALDLLDCWGSEVSSVLCWAFRGVGIRAYNFNNSTLRNIQFNGSDAGDNPWPSPDEDLVRSKTGKIVQVTPERRAALIVKATVATFENLCFEGMNYKRGDPAIYAATALSNFRQIRFEGNTLPGAKIVLPRHTKLNSYTGISSADTARSETLFDCDRDVVGNEFARIGGAGNLDSVFRVGPNFFGNTIGGIGFVQNIPLGDLGSSPNTVHGVQVGEVVVDPNAREVTIPLTSGYYGIMAAKPRR